MIFFVYGFYGAIFRIGLNLDAPWVPPIFLSAQNTANFIQLFARITLPKHLMQFHQSCFIVHCDVAVFYRTRVRQNHNFIKVMVHSIV